MNKLPLVLLMVLLLSPCAGRGQSFVIGDSQFVLNGKPFQILSGEMHYARVPSEYWRDRLLKIKALGLNTVATYVFWNVHEPRQGQFEFSGNADLARFLRTAQEVGLYVILRPGPYACAEWEFGGFPSWLIREHDLKVRTSDPRFLAACRAYISRLGTEVAPLQITRGGPVIMVQVENEYGSFGNDTTYLGAIRNFLRAAGFDVPLFSADGSSEMPNAYLPDVFPGVNGATGESIFSAVRRYRPHGPFWVPEFYPGWLDHWGEPHAHSDPSEVAKDLAWIVRNGISVSLYMVHGGTNFGFMNGANFGGRYQPQPTSYDYDAPIDEAGRLTPKYYAIREVLRKYGRTGGDLPPVPVSPPLITIPGIDMRQYAGLFDRLPSAESSPSPLSMEDIGQSYGYILYQTVLGKNERGLLSFSNLCDYGIVYLNGKKVASLDRRDREHSLELSVDRAPATLSVLVENGGRINYGRELQDNRKGITGSVLFNGRELTGWKIFPFSFGSSPDTVPTAENGSFGPRLYRGDFTIREAGDTYLDLRGWGKGCVWVNGHNLGRYWYIGPQQTLYLPGVWLHEGVNTVVVMELEACSTPFIRGIDHSILDMVEPDLLRPPLPPREAGTAVTLLSDLAAEGNFSSADTLQDVSFTPRAGRYVCLKSLSSQAKDHFASAAEIYLLDEHGKPLQRSQWKIVGVDSEELDAEDGRAENVLDGDPETIWHTEWGARQPDHPHQLIIDLGEEHQLGGLRYLARQGDRPGKIRSYQCYIRTAPFEFSK
ncbi:MAG TPA: beta-galactosidase [Bacteroidota bacterium]|nr:beta-galactosidase [Bacteroidota bacterium]